MITIDFLHNREKKKLNKTDEALVQCRLYHDRKWKVFRLGIKLRKDQWDARKRSVKNHLNAGKLNRKMEDMRDKVKNYSENCFLEDKSINLDELTNILQGKDYSRNFCLYVKEKINQSTEIEESTKKQHKMFLNFLTKFSPDIDMSRITPAFVDEFQSYLLQRPNSRYPYKTLSVNYTFQMLGVLKKYVRKAQRVGYIKDEPFRDFEFKREKKENFVLELEQVKAIYDLDLSTRRGNVAERRDAFVFCCLTGWAYTDCNQFQRKHIIGKTGNLLLKKKRHKTRKNSGKYMIAPISVLFSGLPEQIITPYYKGKLPNARIFSNISLKAYNENIKDFVRLIGLDSEGLKVGSHLARHTAKYLFQEAGFPIQLIAEILGQTELQTTQGYGKEGYTDIGKTVEGFF